MVYVALREDTEGRTDGRDHLLPGTKPLRRKAFLQAKVKDINQTQSGHRSAVLTHPFNQVAFSLGYPLSFIPNNDSAVVTLLILRHFYRHYIHVNGYVMTDTNLLRQNLCKSSDGILKQCTVGYYMMIPVAILTYRTAQSPYTRYVRLFFCFCFFENIVFLVK